MGMPKCGIIATEKVWICLLLFSGKTTTQGSLRDECSNGACSEIYFSSLTHTVHTCDHKTDVPVFSVCSSSVYVYYMQ